ncbi:hypothetical protein QJS10_CPA01g00013 [Acorus calamus]|uniref:Uncharacterized protein n=1 Tax=Acorus calamus TaxID=4465 RepID=A0AAV9FMW6_ACOCL|nr:hypothetical protein QJS10_CPA01g00013 [Acorus calamus]
MSTPPRRQEMTLKSSSLQLLQININNASGTLDQLLGKGSPSTLLHNLSFSRRGLSLWIPSVNKETVVHECDKVDMHDLAPEMPTNMKVCTNAGICYMKKLVCPHICGGGLVQKKHVVQGTGSCVFDCHKCIAHC